MVKHTPSIPPPQHLPEDDYGGIEDGASQCQNENDNNEQDYAERF
jgi:hypothetical protein